MVVLVCWGPLFGFGSGVGLRSRLWTSVPSLDFGPVFGLRSRLLDLGPSPIARGYTIQLCMARDRNTGARLNPPTSNTYRKKLSRIRLVGIEENPGPSIPAMLYNIQGAKNKEKQKNFTIASAHRRPKVIVWNETFMTEEEAKSTVLHHGGMKYRNFHRDRPLAATDRIRGGTDTFISSEIGITSNEIERSNDTCKIETITTEMIMTNDLGEVLSTVFITGGYNPKKQYMTEKALEEAIPIRPACGTYGRQRTRPTVGLPLQTGHTGCPIPAMDGKARV